MAEAIDAADGDLICHESVQRCPCVWETWIDYMPAQNVPAAGASEDVKPDKPERDRMTQIPGINPATSSETADRDTMCLNPIPRLKKRVTTTLVVHI